MKRWLPIATGVAVSAGLLYFAFHNVELSRFLRILHGLRVGWAPALLLLPLMDLWVRSLRWKLLLSPVVGTRVWPLLKLEAVGLGLNNLLFFRAGEFARGYLAAKVLRIPLWSALATILVERLCDTTALLALFGACSFLMGDAVAPPLRRGVLSAACAFTGILLGISGLERALERFALWRRMEARHPRLHRLLRELVLGTGALRSPARAVMIAALSFGLWFCDAGLYWAAARALGFEPALGYLRSVAVLSAACAASALPALPGSFGNFEAGVKAILLHFGYGTDLAVVYAAVIHLITYAVVTFLGIVFLHRFGYSLFRLGRTLRKAGQEGA